MMRHQSLHLLMRLREFALEKEQQKLADRTREEVTKKAECFQSQQELHRSYEHVEGATAFDFLRRDKCVREAGNKHIADLRQLALVQRAREAQIQNMLAAKQRSDMIGKVLEHRQQDDQDEADLIDRKQADDISQNLFVYNLTQNSS